MRKLLAGLGMVVAALVPLAGVGAPGDLDGTFANGGIYTAPVECCSGSRANAVVALPDGRVIVAGVADRAAKNEGSAPEEAIVARLQANGALDTSFGVSGVRATVMNDFMFSAEFADFMARIFGPAAPAARRSRW